MAANLMPNSRFVGAVPGIVGAGGVLPDGATKSSLSGFSVEVVSLADYVLRLKLNYTNSTGSDQFPNVLFGELPIFSLGFPISANAAHASQVRAQRVSGTFPNGATYAWSQNDSGGSFLSHFAQGAIGTSSANHQDTATTHASAAYAYLQAFCFVANGESLTDAVIDLSMPMFETGSAFNAWVPTPALTDQLMGQAVF